MCIKVFLDTEFTDFKIPKLISIGLVTEDLSRSFYAELPHNYTMDDCSYFVQECVIPLLDAKPLVSSSDYASIYAQMSAYECSKHLELWFNSMGDHATIYNNAPHFDWAFLKQLLIKWPINLNTECKLIQAKSEIAQTRYDNTIHNAYRNGYREHHALDDAIVMIEGWKAMTF